MNLEETLRLLVLQVPVDPEELIRFAAEDSLGGWDLDKGGWPTGSLWSVEGKVLYALIRALQPEKVVEVGTHRGCSTTHIATALDVNGKGEVVTIDMVAGTGDLIPNGLNERVSRIIASGPVWLAEQPDESIDIIYEDADHSAETSRDVALLAQKKLKPGGLHIVHDAAHDYAWLGDGSQVHSDVGATIRRGLEAALGDQFRVYRTDPSDCGFALWQKPPKEFAINQTPIDTLIKTDLHSTPSPEVNPVLAQAIAGAKAGDPAVNQESTAVQVEPEEADEEEAAEAAKPASEKAFSDMNRDELVEYAKVHGIDLTGAKTNADRVAKIADAYVEGHDIPAS